MERSTRQKAAIRSAIETSQRPLSPQEILDVARVQVPALSIATVYRNLKQLLQEHAVHVVELPGENPRYESTHAADHHHHHFQCTDCQRVFDVHGCSGDFAYMAPEGFSVERHELTIYGRCADCRPPEKAKAKTGRPAASAGARAAVKFA